MRLSLALLLIASQSITAVDMPLIVAHRGASADAPENTMPAFNLAWDLGADAIECDLRLTADGVIVGIHDEDTKRVAAENLIVENSTYKDLLNLDVGSWHGKNWSGTKIPRISEILSSVPKGKKIFIEIKCGPEILPGLCNALDQSGLQNDQIVIISFKSNVIAAIESERPHIQTMWLKSIKVDEDGQMSPKIGDVLAKLEQIKADGISMQAHEKLDSGYVSKIQNEGYSFHVWTIDEPTVADRFAAMNVQSITTNRPALIKESLARQSGSSN